jgi:hypothetical protein
MNAASNFQVNDAAGSDSSSTRQALPPAENATGPRAESAAMSRLVRSFAHESNNLLAVISLNLEEALEAAPPGSNLHGYLSMALQAAMQGSRLNTQLLSTIPRS